MCCRRVVGLDEVAVVGFTIAFVVGSPLISDAVIRIIIHHYARQLCVHFLLLLPLAILVILP